MEFSWAVDDEKTAPLSVIWTSYQHVVQRVPIVDVTTTNDEVEWKRKRRNLLQIIMNSGLNCFIVYRVSYQSRRLFL